MSESHVIPHLMSSLQTVTYRTSQEYSITVLIQCVYVQACSEQELCIWSELSTIVSFLPLKHIRLSPQHHNIRLCQQSQYVQLNTCVLNGVNVSVTNSNGWSVDKVKCQCQSDGPHYTGRQVDM